MPETEKAPSKEAMEAARALHRERLNVYIPVTMPDLRCGDDCWICRHIAAALEAFAAPWAKAAVGQQKLGMSWMDKAKNGEAERDAIRERNRALVGKIAAWHSGGHAGANHPGHRDACEVGMCGMYREALAADAKAGEDR